AFVVPQYTSVTLLPAVGARNLSSIWKPLLSYSSMIAGSFSCDWYRSVANTVTRPFGGSSVSAVSAIAGTAVGAYSVLPPGPQSISVCISNPRKWACLKLEVRLNQAQYLWSSFRWNAESPRARVKLLRTIGTMQTFG